MSVRSLANKKCFITGAASGIGKATAELAAAEGAELFLIDLKNARLDAVVADIRNARGELLSEADFEYVMLSPDRFKAVVGLDQLSDTFRAHFERI